MALVKTHVLIPGDLLGEVDRAAGPRGRSRFVVEAIREHLRNRAYLKGLKKGAGAWTDENHPDLRTAKDMERHQTRARASIRARLARPDR